MSDFDLDDIRRLDGGLLLVFRELLVRRQATEVGRRLGLSQSAISHALGRLRDLFGDPLFIRRSHGLEPTRRALELGPRIEALIELAAATLSPEGGFDPARSRRRFNLAGPEFVNALIGPALAETFPAQAPEATFVIRRLLLETALDAVRHGEVDLALGAFGHMPPDVTAETLYEETFCVVARRGHPRVKGEIDLQTYADIAHVFVGHPTRSLADEASYDPEMIQAAYGPMPPPGLVRTAGWVSQWATALLMVASSDALSDCPRRFADRYAERLGLQVLAAPYEPIVMPIQAVRRAGAKDPAVDWLLDLIRLAVA